MMVKVPNDCPISAVILAPFEAFNLKNLLSYDPKPFSAVE